ncbi:MAG TPA: NADH-quinone oxidoreductase subunit M [Gammaproteobacteria bacterium]|nr:NADH-quinone oxidoreductase subunit M [Gammaproteobacteria bacterium]
MLAWLLIAPALGALLAWGLERFGTRWTRWVSLAAMLADIAIAIALWLQSGPAITIGPQSGWYLQLQAPWIPSLGISFHLALDGLSLLMVLLTAVLGAASVLISWRSISERVGFFHFNLLLTVAGSLGVFLALDLFLFFFFWELMLVPMYFLISIWGHENRTYAAIKFFIFTQASGLLMFVSILALVFVHHAASGVFTFDYFGLLGTAMSRSASIWLMLGFFVAFAVKLPAFPFHVWLPDAHTEAPTAGSVILAGVLLKTGAYGLIRFVGPLFPEGAHWFSFIAMLLAVIGIIYGAFLAYAQSDFKRLVAYSSISHLGFVMLGVFAFNAIALQGAVMQMIAHGISTGALFMLVGVLEERLHTRDMRRMGGLWKAFPRIGSVTLFFALASLGLPGLGNFIGEFLVLLGAFRANFALTIVGACGFVVSVVYSLAIMQRVFYGPRADEDHGHRVLPDMGLRELTIMTPMIVILLLLGFYPQPMFDIVQPMLQGVISP